MPHQQTQWQFTLANLFALTTFVACCFALGFSAIIDIVGIVVLFAVGVVAITPVIFVAVLLWQSSLRLFWWVWDLVSTYREEPAQCHQFADQLPEFLQHAWFLDSPDLTDEELCQIADEVFLMYDKEEAEAALKNS